MRVNLGLRWVVVTSLLLLSGCDSPSEPAFGALRLLVRTTGGDLDLDGYVATVDGGGQPVAINDTLVVKNLATGDHVVALDGVADNCAPSDGNPHTVTVRGGDTTDFTFIISCVATGLRVGTVTTGLDPDVDGYVVSVDGLLGGIVGANGSLEVTRLAAATHVVSLSAVAPNCTIADNPRSLVVGPGAIADVIFSVACVAATGVIEVTAATSGIDLDGDGYMVQVDSDTSRPLPINGTVRFPGVPGGTHTVTLSGAAVNCSVADANPRTVIVKTGAATRDTARTAFTVSCGSRNGTLRITTVTSGVELDPDGYTVVVDEECDTYYGYYCYDVWHTPVGVNAVVSNPSIPVGPHSVRLDGVARNCTVAGQNPRTVTVPSAATADETFTVTCVQTGSIQVAATTSGVDLDADGYVVSVDGQGDHRTATLGVNGNVTIAGLVPGAYTVTFGGASANCTVTSPSQRAVTVSGGGTASAAFAANCVAAGTLVVSLQGDIYTVKLNGELTRLTFDPGYEDTPAWSRDGTQIAFRRDTEGQAEIYRMSADGSAQTRLTSRPGLDFLASWSPAGKIAFAGGGSGNFEIYVMNSDGTAVTNLTNNLAEDSYPAWSPDGSKIAFSSRREISNGAIYVMAADGSDVKRITDGGYGGDGRPAWSPDGTKIVFHRVVSCDYYSCERDLFVVNAADGSGLTHLTSGAEDEGDPAWSPDGAWIAFNTSPCDYYSGCNSWRIVVVRSDGTDARDVIGGAFHPAWKP